MNKRMLLQNHNLKSTPQRLEIIQVLETKGHVNIDDLYEELKSAFPSLSLSTIYKNINTMLEKGFLSEVKIDGQKNMYELLKHHHSHVVCSECKKIIDIDIDASDILNAAKQISHYDLNMSSLVFHGRCPECAKNLD